MKTKEWGQNGHQIVWPTKVFAIDKSQRQVMISLALADVGIKHGIPTG
jgi:hypothetical protein